MFICVARAAGAQSGELVGSVVAAESGARLSYSAIRATPGGEQFTTDSGTFRLRAVPAGTVHLRVRHLGYVPLDTAVDVPAGETVALRIVLKRLAISLSEVQVTAARSCARPGAPDPSADSALASIFGQLEQNAERYDLLLREYPFTATYEITNGVRRSDTLHATLDVRPAIVESGKHWNYSPGSAVETAPRAAAYVNNPTLDVLVQPEFVKSHCFSYGGREAIEGDTLLEVDFRVADRIHSPDFDGSMYLEPETYLLRYSAFHLSTLPRTLRDADSSSIFTRFDELLPGVPFVADILSTLYVSPDGKPASTEEERRRVAVHFRGDQPKDAYIADVVPHLLPFSARAAPVNRVLGVFDQDSGEPIAGVVVIDSIRRLSVKTSVTGTALLNFLSQAGGALTLTHDGYAPVSLRVGVTPADTAPITVTMTKVSTSAMPHPTAPERIVADIRTADGKPVDNADVSAVRGRDTVVARARTDSAGRASLAFDSSATAYDVVVRKPGYVRADRYVALSTADSEHVTIVVEPIAVQLAGVQVTAERSIRYQRLYIDADSIAASPRPIIDATDIIARLRPDMTFGLGGRGFCPPVQHLWVNGEEVFLGQVTMDEVAIRRAQGNYATRYVPLFIISALARIQSEHIATMHADDCMDLTLGKDRASAIVITLKPGISYDPARGSYVDMAKN